MERGDRKDAQTTARLRGVRQPQGVYLGGRTPPLRCGGPTGPPMDCLPKTLRGRL